MICSECNGLCTVTVDIVMGGFSNSNGSIEDGSYLDEADQECEACKGVGCDENCEDCIDVETENCVLN